MATTLGLILLAISSGSATAARPSQQLLVGAYYYLWFPANLAQGTLRGHLVPRQAPSARLLSSQRRATAVRDIENARQARIDFFAIDWWPYNPGYSVTDNNAANRAMRTFLSAPNIGNIKFCLFYETWNLGFDPGRESTPVTPEMETRFDADMVFFAKHYFNNPSYLRVDGRPVIYLYLTRTLIGDVAGLMEGARKALTSRGFNPFFVGDEIYWRVTPENSEPSGPILTTSPQVARIELFDAVTAYTLYYGDPDPNLGPTKDFISYPGDTNLVADERRLYAQYRGATDGRVPVIPTVSPGYNDRGVRLAVNHPAQPRQWVAGTGPSSTLDHVFNQVAVPSIDGSLPMVMVTAWNEWNEDTVIEPIGGSPTSSDDSSSGSAYTQGYMYGGDGSSDIQTLRRDIARYEEALTTNPRPS